MPDNAAPPPADDDALVVGLTAIGATTADATRIARQFGLSAVYVRSRINAARRTRSPAAPPPAVPVPPPAPQPTDAEREAEFARYLTGEPRPTDTVPALSRRFGLSRVYVRAQLRRAGWRRLESSAVDR